MTFSYNLVLALLLLAPGLGAYAGLFAGVQNGAFRPGAPSPTSVLTLGIIVFGAMFAHLVWVMACLANDAWAGANLPCPLPYIPDAYTVLFTATAGDPRPGDLGVAVFLATSWFLTLANAWLVARAVRSKVLRRRYMRVIYGWLADLVGVSTDARVITAFVVTDIQKDDLTLGYEGVVFNLASSGFPMRRALRSPKSTSSKARSRISPSRSSRSKTDQPVEIGVDSFGGSGITSTGTPFRRRGKV